MALVMGLDRRRLIRARLDAAVKGFGGHLSMPGSTVRACTQLFCLPLLIQQMLIASETTALTACLSMAERHPIHTFEDRLRLTFCLAFARVNVVLVCPVVASISKLTPIEAAAGVVSNVRWIRFGIAASNVGTACPDRVSPVSSMVHSGMGIRGSANHRVTSSVWCLKPRPIPWLSLFRVLERS